MCENHPDTNSSTDPEVLAAWPEPCPHCGEAWQRWGFMEWALHCDCPEENHNG